MDNLIKLSNGSGFKMLYAWGGQSLSVINGKTGEIFNYTSVYKTYTYDDDYVTIPFTATHGMTTYVIAKQVFKYSYAHSNPDSSYGDGGEVNKTSTVGEKIVPNNSKADGAYTSMLIIL